jgi:hypothetical protein
MNQLPCSICGDGQVYEALCQLIPEISMEEHPGTIFQFAAMPWEADWYYQNLPQEKNWCEYVSTRRDGYFLPGSGKFSQNYRFMLLSRDESALGNSAPAARYALEEMDRELSMGISPDLTNDISRWENQADWELTVEIDTDRPTDNAFTRLFQGEAPPSIGETLGLEVKKSILRVKGKNYYTVNRGSWYQEEFIRDDFPLAEGGVLKPSMLFGPGGSLQHVSIGFLVSYHAEMTLVLSDCAIPRFLGRNALSEQPLQAAGLSFSLSKSQIFAANALDGSSQFQLLLPPLNETPQVWGVVSKKAYA